MSPKRKVVVTGLGALAPNGNTLSKYWDALISGKSGIRKIKSFDAETLNVKIAGELKDTFDVLYAEGAAGAPGAAPPAVAAPPGGGAAVAPVAVAQRRLVRAVADGEVVPRDGGRGRVVPQLAVLVLSPRRLGVRLDDRLGHRGRARLAAVVSGDVKRQPSRFMSLEA